MCESQGATRDEILAGLHRGLDRLAEAGAEGLDPLASGRLIKGLRGVIDRAELISVRAIREFEHVEGQTGTGAGDTVGWLCRELKLSPESALDRVLLARQLDRLQETETALEDGSLTFEQATGLSRNANKVRPEDAATVEAGILERRASMNAGRLRQFGSAIAGAVDSAVTRRDASRAWERRSVSFGPERDGVVPLFGTLTAECASYVQAALQLFSRPAGSIDPRSPVQRRHDSLLQVAKGVALGHASAGNARRAQIVVVAPLSAMLGEAGPPPLLQGLVPISQEELDRLVCEADLSAVLKDSAGNIAFAGKRSRIFSPAKRKAMVVNHPTCVFDGCDWPAIDSDAHHVDEYFAGGASTVELEAPGCFVHHPMIHREGWAVLPRGDGTFRTLPPGHPDNPKDKADPDEYMRRRRDAIFARIGERRQKRRRPRKTGSSEPPARSNRAEPIPASA